MGSLLARVNAKANFRRDGLTYLKVEEGVGGEL